LHVANRCVSCISLPLKARKCGDYAKRENDDNALFCIEMVYAEAKKPVATEKTVVASQAKSRRKWEKARRRSIFAVATWKTGVAAKKSLSRSRIATH